MSNELFGQLSPGPLSQDHAHLEGLRNCTQCHDIGNKVPDSKCLACHDEIQTLIDANRGFHASSEVRRGACIDCHSDHHGRKFEMARFSEDDFDHNKTGYKLEGEHAKIDCNSCHRPENISDRDIRSREGTFLGLDQACLSCHDDFHQGTLSKNCTSCHNFEAFRPASIFDHDDTEFPLAGMHKDVDCASCHEVTIRSGREFQKFSDVNFSDCVSCHDDPHNRQLPGKCTQCHTVDGFDNFIGQRRFNHRQTNFQLKGKHKSVSCFACHQASSNPLAIFQDNKRVVEQDCIACHEDEHDGKFGNDCAKCHQETGFRDLKSMDFFDHSVTDFPLEGKHMAVECRDCHEESYTEPMDFSTCMSCHEDFHDGQFAEPEPMRDCASCHTVQGFDHTLYGFEEHMLTAFPLEGAHMATPCFSCHLDGEDWVFKDLSTDCYSCHEDIHDGFISESYYPEKDCTACHSSEGWAEITFDHGCTGWPLEGQHANVSCRSCHFSEDETTDFTQNFANLSNDCIECHDHNHGNQFEINGITNCTRCHNSVNWEATQFDHDLTAFPLEGKHAEISCDKCHTLEEIDGEEVVNYKLESFRCIDCHY